MPFDHSKLESCRFAVVSVGMMISKDEKESLLARQK